MSFKRKSAPSAKSLAFHDYQGRDPKVSSGESPVNSKGQVVDKTGHVLNWPYQRFTVDNELNPKSNQAKPDQLSNNPQAYGDFTIDGKQGGLSGLGKTLG